MSFKTAVDMRWHFENRVKDRLLRHSKNCKAWKAFDQTHKSLYNFRH